MPIEYVQPLLAIFAVGLLIAGLELRASLEPPVCPECGHCRLALQEKARRADEARRRAAKHLYGIDDDDDAQAPRH